MLIDRFIANKSDDIAQNVIILSNIIFQTHPAIITEWKWNTLVFSINKKVIAYFSIKQQKLQLGFWNMAVLSSPIVKRDLKIIGYYLIEKLDDELLADVAISCAEIVKERLKKKV